MPKPKLRLYINIFVDIIFISYLWVIIFTDIIDAKWSFGFLLFITIIYIIRDILAPKQKQSDDNEKA